MIGKIVKFKIPGLNGPRIVAGTVKRIIGDGKIEIKSQQDGYFIVNIIDLITPIQF